MKFYITTLFLLLAAIGQSQSIETQTTKILDFVSCDEQKETFTYHLQRICKENEVILKSILLRHKGSSQEKASTKNFHFLKRPDGSYELYKGRVDWDSFAEKLCSEIDYLVKEEEIKQERLLLIARKDSLIRLKNELPGLEKKRDNFWTALKDKKDRLEVIEEEYQTAKTAYENGDLEPSKWSKIETEYFAINDEIRFIKASLKEMTDQVSEIKTTILRLKSSAKVYQDNYYHQNDDNDNENQ